ncbi:MAG: hypothetical protein JF602_08475, partial [Gemmatimonadetes bacterium]|nr:hypothetical protein [Gemmatimonadota bacterium]
MRQSVVRSVIAFALFVVAACDNPTGPEQFAGRYRLERYEGAAMPAISYESGSTSVTILQASLLL